MAPVVDRLLADARELLGPALDALAGQARDAFDIWLSGGWAMIGIAAIALVMFGLGVHVHLRLQQKGFLSVPEERWRRWIDRPLERRGPIGRLVALATRPRSLSELVAFFDQLVASETAPFERDLRVMKVCVSAAPLVGLLGTVTGMLDTFGALSAGSGGDQTMKLVSAGISVALITTETGLVVALPGLFFHHRLQRRFRRYEAFLAHLQTVCTQSLHEHLREEAEHDAHRAAHREVARILRRRLELPQPRPQGKAVAGASTAAAAS